MRLTEYDRQKAVDYADKWALSFNPAYYNFSDLGGDCTNFVSQCILAGAGVMNYQKLLGWYYVSLNNRSPSWTGVEFLREFLLNNDGVGPFGEIVGSSGVKIGDVVQFYDGTGFYHSAIISGFSRGEPLISAHTQNVINRPLSTYSATPSFIKINAVRR